MELCPCPECGLPAEVIPTDGSAAAAAAPKEPDDGGDDRSASQIVGVRCIHRHWFLGPRERLVA
jgi:hypothetical protein